MDGSTRRELPLPPGSKFAGSPSWSPDGRRLAFDADVGGTWHVYIATPEGGTLRRLTSDRTSDARPRWSRDGRFIYFASLRSGGDWQVWKALADTEDADARAVQITRSSAIEAEESLDGRYVYYAKRWVAGVFRLSLDAPGAREEKVFDFAGEGRWHLGARGILALDLESGRPTIRSYEFASGATSMVLELPLAPWDFPRLNRAFTASPGRALGAHRHLAGRRRATSCCSMAIPMISGGRASSTLASHGMEVWMPSSVRTSGSNPDLLISN